ncbi:MAG: methyl-accepting chemotaxis protein [Lachnospiraceae bacterium]|nr:methyl-accepting chemotaxis protein [Lachnospiraceae bacterium]
MSKRNRKETGRTSVSRKLSVISALMLIISMVAVELIAMGFGYGMIKGLIDASLKTEVKVDADLVNKELNSTFYYLNGVADAIEQNDFKKEEDLRSYLQGTVGRYDLIPTGVYVALEDNTFIYPADPSIEKGFEATQKPWYKEAMGYTNAYYYYYDKPYFDKATGDLCSTVQRHVHLKDGREGVVVADLMMSDVQKLLSEVKLYDSGKAMMVTSEGMILSYSDKKLNGSNIKEQKKDKFLSAVSTVLRQKDGQVRTVRAGDRYYMSSSTIDGTDWKVIIYAKTGEVLSQFKKMILTLVLVTVAAVLVVLVTMIRVLSKMIKQPVDELTGNIEKIAGGDFTVEVQGRGNDEIAFMNSSMGNFITGMRGSLSDIKNVSERLREDAHTSQDTAGSLEDAAQDQSSSMEQIRANISNMADAVTEVAESATTLAQTIEEVTEGEEKIESSMNELVEKARIGQKDMVSVAEGMDHVVASMADMAEAVGGVDEAAQKINDIVDMISAISSQTNLLSLNASIEAARAGEAGRGFAVVATEIGNLANNSAEATSQIAEIIQEMSSRVQLLSEKSEANSQLINSNAGYVSSAAVTFEKITAELSEATDTLNDMAKQMEKVNDVAMNMASISEEQSASTQEIASTVDLVTEAARGVANSSDQVLKASKSVADAVDVINHNLERFTI